MHLAAYEIGVVGKRRIARVVAENIEGTRHALETARDAGARRIVYTSSIVVYGATGGRVTIECERP
jgi:nucleoside-diphosphate-sugar epimerase